MKSLIDLIFIFGFVFIGNGCEQTTPATQKPSILSTYSNPFFPLDVGDYWVYKEIGSTHDSVKRSEIIGTSVISRNSYFMMKETYYGKPASWNDTILFRFTDSNMLVRYIDGIDSPYINFSLPAVSSQLGQKYPGVLNSYPFSDSISIGRFDSLKYIIFRGPEPLWSEFAKNIGGIEWDYPATMTLVRAKVNGNNYP